MHTARSRRVTAIALWLVLLMACGAIISRTRFTADLSAFLPSTPTPAQQLLMDQLREGIASRLILVGIQGADSPARASVSKEMAATLRKDSFFITVNNGEPVNNDRDRAFLFNNRYLLSPAVTPERFTPAGLHAALGESIDLLASPAGLMVKSLLPRDPTGEMVQLLGQFSSGSTPALANGAWASRDGKRALLLVQTRASGSDTDAQQLAMAAIQTAFHKAAGANTNVKLLMTGPGVFSVTSRDTIKDQVSQLFIISSVLIAALLLAVYRSVLALALGFLPVVSGVLAAVAAVSLGFGSVHGITLGFGTALIGEAVDYSIYLFVQSEQSDNDQQGWVKRFWPTVRLGVMTSLAGFSSLLLSGFPGLAQLGLYSIAGLLAAALVTRYVLPHLLPGNFRIHDISGTGRVLQRLVARAALLRWPAILLVMACCAALLQNRNTLFNENISSLSPVSVADVALDASLRGDMGAPDVRYVVVITGKGREAVLQSAEKISSILQTQVDAGELARFESPSRYLPSIQAQQSRQQSLPTAEILKARLVEASSDLPVRPQLFAPFLADVAAARGQALLTTKDLERTSMAMAVEALLTEKDGRWSALLPLTAPEGGNINPAHIVAALGISRLSDVLFIDMKAESDNLYAGYLHEATLLSLGGMAAIAVLLLLAFRSVPRVLRAIGPLIAAVVTVTAGLSAVGQQLTILHLVGLLLVVAVGSNYALFFDRQNADLPMSPRTLASMLLANVTTVTGFGLLALSKVSLLQAMGMTVAPGVILALLYSAIFSSALKAPARA
jgi:predicted exporter